MNEVESLRIFLLGLSTGIVFFTIVVWMISDK